MVEIDEYKMRPGEYIEDVDIESVAEEQLEGNPLIVDYEWTVIDNGSKKNTLGFGVEFMDAKEALEEEEYSVDTFDDALSRVNAFLEEITGRDADLRSESMKP